MPAKTLLILLALLLPLGVQAAPPEWNQLSPDQQQILGRYQGNWDAMPEHKRRRLADNAARWSSMTPEQRQRARTKHEAMKTLSPQQRQDLRQRFQPTVAALERLDEPRGRAGEACRGSAAREHDA